MIDGYRVAPFESYLCADCPKLARWSELRWSGSQSNGRSLTGWVAAARPRWTGVVPGQPSTGVAWRLPGGRPAHTGEGPSHER